MPNWFIYKFPYSIIETRGDRTIRLCFKFERMFDELDPIKHTIGHEYSTGKTSAGLYDFGAQFCKGPPSIIRNVMALTPSLQTTQAVTLNTNMLLFGDYLFRPPSRSVIWAPARWQHCIMCDPPSAVAWQYLNGAFTVRSPSPCHSFLRLAQQYIIRPTYRRTLSAMVRPASRHWTDTSCRAYWLTAKEWRR